ncbi:cytochrome c-type biogenesis protein CcmI [Erwinia toletana]|uniref:Cytochrome c-type biogenesis protein CcmI n=1 Tax=Winslowiella toletana TaxID=92490 RepID=A0ABS4P4Y7_9GAMM|nr:c-type cytochrome biogenesis protein CcmI [Winslowiella toletana]MBP2167704.1 cytochrome c-type biogenesis protein CcmI [Winslowiella toletana]
MSGFWLTLIALLLAASALLLIAGWRSRNASAAERDKLNTAFYHQRLQELEQDEAQGVVAERPEMVRELQQTLLTDIPDGAYPQARSVSRWVLLPGVLLIFIVSLALYFNVGGLPQLMAWQQVKNDLPALRGRVMDPDGRPLSMEELARLGLGIRSELQTDPTNLDDWMMLGRIGMVLNNPTTAGQAFQHALQLSPGNQEVKLSYAEVLTRSGDAQDNREAEVMLLAMQKEDSQNLRVLGLLAFNAYQQQHYDRAIAGWQQMLTLLPAGDRRIEMIQRSIEQAKTDSGEQNSKLALTVKLSAAAEKMLPEGGVLYISVSDGVSPVPVAVKKLPLSHFPLSLTLDDSNAMMPDRLLSAQHQVRVRVRISRNGSANPQSGDWLGESAATPYDGHQQLSVAIDRQQP